MEFGVTNLMITKLLMPIDHYIYISTCYRELSRQTYKCYDTKTELKKMPNYGDSQPNEVEKYVKIWMKQLHEKYDNLAGVDKVYAAQQKVDEVQIVMEENIHNMINNSQQLNNLDEKAENLKIASEQFKNQSHELAKIMYWRNMKLKIPFGLIVLAGMLYIIVPIAVDVSN